MLKVKVATIGFPTKQNYVYRTYKNGTSDKSYTVKVLRQTNLKGCYIVRYADDFKIFCKKRSDAVKIFEGAKKWLLERLGLEINLKRHYSEFLEFKLKVHIKGSALKKILQLLQHSNRIFKKIAYDVKKSLYNIWKHRLQKKGQITNRYIAEK